MRSQRIDYNHQDYQQQRLHGEEAQTVSDRYPDDNSDRPDSIDLGGNEYPRVEVLELKYADNAEKNKYDSDEHYDIACYSHLTLLAFILSNRKRAVKTMLMNPKSACTMA